MPRPTPPPHPVSLFLAEHHPGQVSAGTSKKYAAVLRRMEKSKLDPKEWLRAQVIQTSRGKKAARMTVGVYRSAILYYLRWQHYEKTGEVLDGAEAALRFSPDLMPVSAGLKGEERGALTRNQYSLYQETVLSLVTHTQIQAVLLALPFTGMRISEMCGLKRKNVLRKGPEWVLAFRGKGDKPRTVPVGEEVRTLIAPFMEGKDEEDYLFENPCLGLPGSTLPNLSPAQVRAVVRDEIQTVEGLEDVTPHVLRHHFSTAMLRVGVDLYTAKEILGHSSLTTMERYMHPDEDMKREAVEKLSGALNKQLEER